jgi:WD40-like Beta Propeller Repeat
VTRSGRLVAYVKRGEVFVRPAAGGPERGTDAPNRPLLLRFDRAGRTLGVAEIGGLGSTQVCLYRAALPARDAGRRCIATGLSSGFDFLPSGRVVMSTRSSANAGRTRLCQLAPPGAPQSGCERDVVADSAFDLESPAVSPDGRQVAVVRTTRSTRGAIAIYDLRSGLFVRQVTRGPADGVPAWSPDGSSIVFDRGPSGRRGLWVVAARGGTAERRLTQRGELPTWSR